MKFRIGFLPLAGMLASSALAQDAKVISLTDVAAPVPTVSSVSGYTGPLPPGGTAVGAARDIPQMPGFPVTTPSHPNFAPIRGAVLVDLDGDRDLEILAASTAGALHAWHHNGQPVAGFPVNMMETPQYAPSVGELDGDDDPEIVQLTRGFSSGGWMYALDHQGRVLPGFPIQGYFQSCPTLYDLDGDRRMEIIVGERVWPVGYLRIFRGDGTQWGGNWPVTLDHVPAATVSVGDVDKDGQPEIFAVSYNSMYLLETDGTSVPGWPRQIASANFSYQSAALADLDGDRDLEIVVGAHRDAAGCYLFHHTGALLPGWPKLLGTWTYCPPTVTDLDGDRQFEILDGRAGVFGGRSAAFWAWNVAGQVRPGFPIYADLGGGSEGPLTVADIDGDGRLEIFADYNITQGGQGFLFGVDADGNSLPDFPLRPLGFTYMNGATIGDVDNDGDYELAVISRDGGMNVNLYTLPQRYRATGVDWKIYHGRLGRGGLFPAEGGGGGGEPCGERATLSTKCKSGGAKVIASLKRADANTDVTFTVDGGDPIERNTGNKGKAKAKWTGLPRGEHTVDVCDLVDGC